METKKTIVVKLLYACVFIFWAFLGGILLSGISTSTYISPLALEVRSAFIYGNELGSSFSTQAREHMFDVHRLFLIGIGVFVALSLFVIWKRSHFSLTFVGITGVLVLLALVFFFTPLFLLFHYVFFTNDLWLFPDSDLLVQIFSHTFFYSVTIFSFLRAITLATLFVVLTQLKQT